MLGLNKARTSGVFFLTFFRFSIERPYEAVNVRVFQRICFGTLINYLGQSKGLKAFLVLLLDNQILLGVFCKLYSLGVPIRRPLVEIKNLPKYLICL
jgi:hypothetical protein